MKSVFFLAVTALFALVGCGSDKAGDTCSTEDAGNCSSNVEALICNDGTLKAIPCSGPAGCTEGDKQFVCDFSRAKAGDACPKSVEAGAQCDAGNANQALKCTSGVWQAQACRDCAVQSGSIACSP